MIQYVLPFQGNPPSKHVGEANEPIGAVYALSNPVDVDGGKKKRGSRFEIPHIHLVSPTVDLTCVFV